VSQATGYRLQAEWKIRVNDVMDNLFSKMKNYSPIIGIHFFLAVSQDQEP